jgi:DNA-binding transcriptional MerR regulator
MMEIYSPSHVQELLGIDSNTLRKYATLLEGQGYPIHRNSRGHRGYFEKDINTIRKFIDYSSQEGMTLELSAQAIMTSISDENKAITITDENLALTEPDKEMSLNNDFNELMERIENLERINMDLIKLLKEKAVREAYLEDKMNQILKYVERTEQLIEERSNFMLEETSMQIAASQQPKWWQWWK